MLVFPCLRQALIECLPKNLVAAEIGVATGDFSQDLLRLAQPSRLHLIDAWIYQDQSDLAGDNSNLPQGGQDDRYHAVLSRFQSQIAVGQVQVHRGMSHSAATQFPDGYFDWIYVDADHRYEAVKRDLETYLPKLKPEGLILGHDYKWHGKVNFGVVEAVNEFVVRHGLEFLALNSGDMFPTYALARPGSRLGVHLLGKATFSMPCVLELRGYPRNYKFGTRSVTSGQERRGFLSFGFAPQAETAAATGEKSASSE